MTTVYLDIDDLLAAADAALAPVPPKIRDLGLLEAALARPQARAFGVDPYPSLFEKAAALLESLARNHALVDGNERLAWVATRLFLIVNDSDARPPSPKVGDAFIRSVAQGQVEVAEIAATLRGRVDPEDEREPGCAGPDTARRRGVGVAGYARHRLPS